MSNVILQPGSVSPVSFDPSVGIRKLVDLGGRERWKRRYELLKREYDEFPAGQESLFERHHVELCVFPAYQKLRRGDLGIDTSPPHLDAYGVATFIAKLHSLLSPQRRNRLAGRVVDALQRDFGFAALRTELTAIGFLHELSCEVVPTDFEDIDTFDFAATRANESIELECKLLTHDFGQQIRNSSFRRLHRYFGEVCDAEGLPEGASVVTRVEAPSGLPIEDAELRTLAALLRLAVVGTDVDGRLSSLGLTVELADWPTGRERPNLVHSEARWLTVVEGWHTFAREDGNAAVIVAIRGESTSPERVLENTTRKFKDAASQMSGSVDGVLFCEIEGPVVDKPLRLMISRTFEGILQPVFAARPFLKLVILGFPGPPFTLGAAHAIVPSESGSDATNLLVKELTNLAVTEEVPPQPGWEFRKSWFEKKYRWEHKTKDDIRSSVARLLGTK